MEFALSHMFLLLLTATITARGLAFSDDDDAAAHSRPERGLKIMDLLRQDTTTKSPKGTGIEDNGFNLEDALVPESKNLDPSKIGWQDNMIQKLDEVIKNQDQEIEMLRKLLARGY